MVSSKALVRAISSPARVASLLETSRGRPLLALEIQRSRIGIAVVHSPLDGPDDVERLPDIRLQAPNDNYTNLNSAQSTSSATRRIPHPTIDELASTIRSHDVCGFIVGWPLQRDTGKMGGPCGRVVYTLESMLEDASTSTSDSSRPLLSCHRPLCLWTPKSVLDVASPFEDAWGRCAAYGKVDHETLTSSKTIHLASREQYAFDDTAQATDLWEDFWKTHWPELYGRSKERKMRSRDSTSTTRACGNNLVADWREAPGYMMAAEVAL